MENSETDKDDAQAALASLRHLNSKFRMEINELRALSVLYNDKSELQNKLDCLEDLKKKCTSKTDDFNSSFGKSLPVEAENANIALETSVLAYFETRLAVDKVLKEKHQRQEVTDSQEEEEVSLDENISLEEETKDHDHDNQLKRDSRERDSDDESESDEEKQMSLKPKVAMCLTVVVFFYLGLAIVIQVVQDNRQQPRNEGK